MPEGIISKGAGSLLEIPAIVVVYIVLELRKGIRIVVRDGAIDVSERKLEIQFRPRELNDSVPSNVQYIPQVVKEEDGAPNCNVILIAAVAVDEILLLSRIAMIEPTDGYGRVPTRTRIE